MRVVNRSKRTWDSPRYMPMRSSRKPKKLSAYDILTNDINCVAGFLRSVLKMNIASYEDKRQQRLTPANEQNFVLESVPEEDACSDAVTFCDFPCQPRTRTRAQLLSVWKNHQKQHVFVFAVVVKVSAYGTLLNGAKSRGYDCGDRSCRWNIEFNLSICLKVNEEKNLAVENDVEVVREKMGGQKRLLPSVLFRDSCVQTKLSRLHSISMTPLDFKLST